MNKRYIQSFKSLHLDPEDSSGILSGIRSSLPRKAARRMSTLGMLLTSVLEDQPLDLETTLIYGTTFTEAKALEAFLDSLPYASPTAFQTSIHPGGIEQALILKNHSVGAFFPFAGDEDLFAQMLKCSFTTSTSRTLLCGGEEAGGWLREFGVASSSSFAFSLLLSDDSEKSIGSIEWNLRENGSGFPVLKMEEAIRVFVAGRETSIGDGVEGHFKISMK